MPATPATPGAAPNDDENLLKRVRVATPCSADWEAMPGGERVRSCEHCRKKVYNLSAMTATEAASLVRKAEGNVCVRFHQRADGTMLTQDCPVGVQRARARAARAVAAACGAVVAFGASTGAFRRGEPPVFVRWLEQRLAPPAVPPILGAPVPLPPSDVPPMMGEMVPEPVPIQGKMAVQPREIMGDMAVAPPAPAPPARMGRVIALPMIAQDE